MSNSKVSDLPIITDVNENSTIPIVQDGITSQITAFNLGIINQSNSAQTNSSAWISGVLKVDGEATFNSKVSVRELSSIAATDSNLIHLSTNDADGKTGINARTNGEYGFDIYYDDNQARGRGLHLDKVQVVDGNIDAQNTLYIDRETGKSNFKFEISAPTYKVTNLDSRPTNANSVGDKGDIRYTADFIYLCVDTDTWKRTALSSWS
jgi:hypothetical protein